MGSFTLTIPEPTPSLNTWLALHWAQRQRIKANWLTHVQAQRNNLKIPKATSKRRVVVTRFGARELDRDNAFGGAKGLLDTLKAAGLLVDDSPTWCEYEVYQVPGTKYRERRTEILIEAID